MDIFGITNYLGLAATLILVLLLALSNDRALRRFGTRRWKALQRLNYILLGLVSIHALVYFSYENRGLSFISMLVIVVSVVVGIQLAGLRKRNRMQIQANSVDPNMAFQ